MSNWFRHLRDWFHKPQHRYPWPYTPQVALYLNGSSMLIATIQIEIQDGLPLGRNLFSYSVDGAPAIILEVVSGSTFEAPVGSTLVCQNQFIDARGVIWFPSDQFTVVVPGKSPQVTLNVIGIRSIPDKLSPPIFSALSLVDADPPVPTIQ